MILRNVAVGVKEDESRTFTSDVHLRYSSGTTESEVKVKVKQMRQVQIAHQQRIKLELVLLLWYQSLLPYHNQMLQLQEAVLVKTQIISIAARK